MPSPRRITFNRILLGVASVFVSLLIAEVIARVFSPARTRIPWVDWAGGITTARPSQRGRLTVPDTFDVEVSINAQRFRGRQDVPLTPTPGTIRIAALGDSLTFGWGAEDDETYPAQLAHMLAKPPQPTKAEVINAGVCDTGTGEQALYYDTWVKKFHPQVVILNVFVNDVGDDSVRSFFFLDAHGNVAPRAGEGLAENGAPRSFTSRASGVFPGYSLLARYSRLFNLTWNAALEGRAHWAREPSGGFVKVGLPILAGEVSWLNRSVEASGARLIVVFLPPREVLYPSTAAWATKMATESEAIVTTLRDACSRNGVPFIDITPALRGKARQVAQPLYYHELDGHPTPEGYRIIAEAVAAFLLNMEVFRSIPQSGPALSSPARPGDHRP